MKTETDLSFLFLPDFEATFQLSRLENEGNRNTEIAPLIYFTPPLSLSLSCFLFFLSFLLLCRCVERTLKVHRRFGPF